MPSFQRELDAARAAADLASHAILELYAGFTAIADAPADISTEADKRSQEIILQSLSQSLSNDAYCAEEDSPTLRELRREGPRLWIIDPIDGSRGFAKKLGEFSVMIGLVVDGMVEVGVVAEPARKRLTHAIRGGGCWRSDNGSSAARCHVSSIASWAEARLVRSHAEKNADNRALNAVAKQLFTYSAGIKLALVARGEADVYLSTYAGFNSWDLCAGHLLVDEAGGRVADLHGRPIFYRTDGLGKIDGTIATNGMLQETARSLLTPT